MRFCSLLLWYMSTLAPTNLSAVTCLCIWLVVIVIVNKYVNRAHVNIISFWSAGILQRKHILMQCQ
jgi:hypothetical protein